MENNAVAVNEEIKKHENGEYSTLSYDAFEVLQKKIISNAEKIMLEFHTLPKTYIRAFHCLCYDLNREERLGATTRVITENGIAFEKEQNNKLYLTRTVDGKTKKCQYAPRTANNQLFLFYLSFFKSIKKFKVENKEDLCHMNFILNNGKDCRAYVLPKDIKKANAILQENHLLRQTVIENETKENNSIQEKKKNKNLKETKTNVQMGYELLYIVKDLDYAKQLTLDDLECRFIFNYGKKFSELAWNQTLRTIPHYGIAPIKKIVELKEGGEK